MERQLADEQESPSLDQTIAEEYRAILERNSAEETPAEPLEKTAKEESAPAEETEEQKAERARDEQGRFAKQQPKAKAKESAAPAQQADSSAATAQTPPPQGAPAAADSVTRTDGKPVDLSRAPASWTPAAKAAWNGLPEPIRAEIHRREVDAYKRFNESAPDAEFGRNVRTLGERYRQVVDLDGGGDVAKAIGGFFQTASLLRFGTPAQKRQAIDYLEQFYGIPAKQQAQAQYVQQPDGTVRLVEQPAAPQQQAFQDPRIDQLMASMNAQEQARLQAEERTANDATTRFLSATNDKGEPLYPFVDNVIDDMTARVQALRGRGVAHEDALKQAYDAAVWANPETRAELIKQQAAQLEQQRREENLRRTAEAKRAARGNVAPRGAHPQEPAAGKMEDTITQTYREIMSRA